MDWIDAGEAAGRLGVKPATLYAYVSRGVLRRRHSDDGRRSLFDAAEVEQLARRGRPRRPPPASELVIESQLTALGVDRPHYRGRDAIALARGRSFEQVASWLWTGDPGWLEEPSPTDPGTGPDGRGPWTVEPAARDAALTAQRGLPDGVLPLDRLQVITTVLAATDPLRFQLDPPAVVAAGQNLIAGFVDCLPAPSPGTGDRTPASSPGAGDPTQAQSAPAGGSIAARLWSRLTTAPPDPGLARVLEAALVVLADHELAASTLAARVAASVRADPYAVVLAGLGALSGPLHGGASFGAERMLAEIRTPADAPRVLGERLRRGDRVPGLGHTVYKSGDARGILLFELLREAVPGHDRLAAAEAVLAEARRRRLPAPNVDFALATLAAVADMIPGAGEAIFAVARTSGWLAHAAEEYAHGRPLRFRAVYTGAAPG